MTKKLTKLTKKDLRTEPQQLANANFHQDWLVHSYIRICMSVCACVILVGAYFGPLDPSSKSVRRSCLVVYSPQNRHHFKIAPQVVANFWSQFISTAGCRSGSCLITSSRLHSTGVPCARCPIVSPSPALSASMHLRSSAQKATTKGAISGHAALYWVHPSEFHRKASGRTNK